MTGLLKCHKELLDLDISNSFKNGNFDSSIKIMMNKDTIKIAENFINSLALKIKFKGNIINPREFISIFLITYYSDDVLSKEKSNIETILYNKANDIDKIINNIDIKSIKEVCDLIQKCNQFKKLFNSWKKKDLESQIELYCHIFFDYKNKIDGYKELKCNKNDEYLTEIEYMKDKTYSFIVKLLGEDGAKETVDKYNYKEVDYEKTINNLVRMELEKAYWASLLEDINNNNYKSLTKIFIEISHFFIDIYKKRPEYVKYISEFLDIEFISAKIRNTIDIEYIKQLLVFILKELLKVDAPVKDEITNDYIKKVSESSSNHLSLLVDTLKYIMPRIELLKKITE